MDDSGLRRVITLPQLLFYGLGTMVGGGFYALTGKVATQAGLWTPAAFLLAGLLALLNAFAFAELSARLPYSAGEARYVEEAFGWRWLSALVGWLVITTGVVSAATLAVATVGFLQDLLPVPDSLGRTLNLSLWRMKRRGDPLPEEAPSYPIVLSMLGFAACLGFLAFRLWSAATAE